MFLSSSHPPDQHAPRLPLLHVLAETTLSDPAEQVASFGRWWFDPQESQLVLSVMAAAFLDVEAGLHADQERCFAQVVPDDVLTLMSALTQTNMPGQLVDCEFRVINEVTGLRWLRMLSIPQPQSQQNAMAGVLLDITSSRHAAMRERFSFESTQVLVGAQSLERAVNKVIQLVCETLGWDWGAYWAIEGNQGDIRQLGCKHYWHNPGYTLESFTQQSAEIRMAPDEGLVGHVWSTGQACWIENMAHDPDFLRRKSAGDCGLQSGYAFPVAYITADGRRHSPGVLEFFSSLSRQREAQLPNLSVSIGALVAQTVQRFEQEERIRRLAQIDDLTGLANRSYLYQLLDTACLSATASNAPLGVLYIDLDHFKPINDAFGHEAGNMVLCEFAQRLQKLASEGCHVGRLGGDEFVILSTVVDCGQLYGAQLRALAEQVLLAARKPFLFEENELVLSASVGISVFPDNGWTGPELLRSADAAMYRSKQSGRNELSFFSSSTSKAVAEQQSFLVQQLTIEAGLHHALIGNEFFLEYQPVFDSFGERIIAAEALIRWRRPNGEIVQPDVFIPIAEQSRLIVQIGRWVIEQVCCDLSWLRRAGFPELQININMAAPAFINANLPDELAAVMEAFGIATHNICLELTESMVMRHTEQVIPVMRTLRQLGFKISLDDFGMGHSSLSRLKSLPISSVKIDRSFVSGLPHNREDCAIVRTILDLGRNMKLQVIAEGIETDAQLVFLRQFGCQIQGFLLSRPMSLDDISKLHRLHQAPATS
jgi:diguanylate cyclase (GGDEF)-like protein